MKERARPVRTEHKYGEVPRLPLTLAREDIYFDV
jgi:hypothetical protein